MHDWISTTERLPKDEEWVEIKMPSDAIYTARITLAYRSEMAWQTKSGLVAHLNDYSKIEHDQFQISLPDLVSPVAWRPLAANAAKDNK